jgi:hypothetical protein
MKDEKLQASSEPERPSYDGAVRFVSRFHGGFRSRWEKFHGKAKTGNFLGLSLVWLV